MNRKFEVMAAIEFDACDDYAAPIADNDLTDYCGIQADMNPDDCDDEPLPTGYYNRAGDWVSFDGAELLDLADFDDSIACDDDTPF